MLHLWKRGENVMGRIYPSLAPGAGVVPMLTSFYSANNEVTSNSITFNWPNTVYNFVGIILLFYEP